MAKKSVAKKVGTVIGVVLSVILAVAMIIGDVAAYRYDSVITRWWSGTFTKVDNSKKLGYTTEQARANSEKLAKQAEAEGAVLLKNNGSLPLKPGKINLVGYSSNNPVYISAGSVAQDPKGKGSKFIDFYAAFQNAGFKPNNDLKTYYDEVKNSNKRDDEAGGMFKMMGSDYNIYDQAIDSYSAKLDEAKKYSDTAVVVISRTGGEGGDEPLDMAEYTNGDKGKHYLQLQKNEQDMINYVEKTFDKVVVLINSSNPMELGFLDDKGIDAAVWIGGPGAVGLQSVADIIAGKVNPSGKLSDTYAYDLKTAPSFYTGRAGTYTNYDAFDGSKKGYDNKVDGGVTWYTEGIYVGYRYYETAAAEGYIDYDKTVQYPFGYGLSYTNFDWKVTKQNFGKVHGNLDVEVQVTNTGKVAGKDVVELYVTAPYTKGGIEKSAKELVGFAKTKELKPGESQTVKITAPIDDLASYDYQKNKAYVLEKGNYQFNVQTDSHNVKKGTNTMTYTVDSDKVYNDKGVGKRSTDKVIATNQFDIVTKGDGNIGSKIPYVSRADFAGTFPGKTMGGKHITEMKVEMGKDAIEYMNSSEGGSDVKFENDKNYKTISKIPVKTSQKNGLTVKDVAGYKNWDDPIWDKLVNQMSIDDMVKLISDGAYGTPAIKSIGKGTATDVDGPAGVSSANLNYYGTEFTSEIVMASTWNTELINEIGKAVAQEAKSAGISGWYAPGGNTHRSPFNGRSGEYYSEDPVLGGQMMAAEVSGAEKEGVYTYSKHFALNDQDSKRGGMYTWANEQSIREIYLRTFEYAVKDGKTSGVMEAYNRVGPMEASTSYALNTAVLRNEWGFNGVALTDGYAPMIGSDKYNNPDLQLRAGAGMLLFIGGYKGQGGVTEKTTKSEKGIEMLHDMSRRIIYVYANSAAIGTQRDYTPYWIAPVVALNVVVFGGIALAWIIPALRRRKKAAKADADASADDAEVAAASNGSAQVGA